MEVSRYPSKGSLDRLFSVDHFGSTIERDIDPKGLRYSESTRWVASSKKKLFRYLGSTKMVVVQEGGVSSETISSKREARRLMERMKILTKLPVFPENKKFTSALRNISTSTPRKILREKNL